MADDHDWSDGGAGRPEAELPGAHARQLEPAKQAAWDQATAAARELSAALREGRKHDADQALDELRVDRGLDWAEVRDALHLPTDAAEFRDDLEAILRRIPDGWGRWLSIGRGWYPIVSRLHRRLTRLDPDYLVHQVKEKYGGLRYYFRPSPSATERTEAAMQSLVQGAEAEAARTCERCGAAARLYVTANGVYQTRCQACVEADPSRGWRPATR